jgi:hypothetical protein
VEVGELQHRSFCAFLDGGELPADTGMLRVVSPEVLTVQDGALPGPA